MKISSVNNIYTNRFKTGNKSNITTNPNINKNTGKSIFDKGFFNVSFGSNPLYPDLYNWYKQSLPMHKNNINQTEPAFVENYCAGFGIPCFLRNGKTRQDNQFLAYSVYNGIEILRQLNLPLPAFIDIAENETQSPNALAWSYHFPTNTRPIRSVIFNRNVDWANTIDDLLKETEKEQSSNSKNFLSSKHFLRTTLHEFGHTVHFHKLYSKFGCPFPDPHYYYNPNTLNIVNALKSLIYDQQGRPCQNPYITPQTRTIVTQSSGYGKTQLVELLAEEFTKAITDNLNYDALRLRCYPFNANNISPELNAVLQETWEGLIGDGQGFI